MVTPEQHVPEREIGVFRSLNAMIKGLGMLGLSEKLKDAMIPMVRGSEFMANIRWPEGRLLDRWAARRGLLENE